MNSSKYIAFFVLACGRLVYANTPLPIPQSYLTLDYLRTSNYSAGSSCVNVNGVACGGEFTGLLGIGAGDTSPIAINFWCVDAQENFGFGQSGLAQVVALSGPSGIATQPNNVTYSGVTNNGSPSWTFSSYDNGSGSFALATDATTRYEMAAYLVTKFPQFDTSVNGADPVSTAIEGAIWDIMSNNTATVDSPFYDPEQGNTTSDVGYWVYQASLQTNYSTTANNFAVISWVANSSGSGLQTPAAQTFLVELDSPTPEPGFYGALAIGLTGLFFAVRRRKA